MKLCLSAWVLVGILLGIIVSSDAGEMQTVGWVETAVISPGNFKMQAKIDSGADNSSINALDVTEYTRGGEKWVRFSIVNKDGQSVALDRRIIRIAKIKRRVSGGEKKAEPRRRPVVILGICVGRVYREVEVNLADRSHFKYPLLIGRSYMKGHILIDPSKRHTAEPRCEGSH